MHEFSIVSHLFELVARDAEKHGAIGVSRIRVKIGVMSGVVPQLFSEAFHTVKRGTLAENAELDIIHQEIVISCACGYTGGIKDRTFICPKCGEHNIEVKDGEELILQQLELELPDAKES